MPDSPVIEITEPIEIRIVEDRLLFTCVSGKRRQTFSISHHKASNAAMCAALLLDEHRSRALPDNVRDFARKR